MLPFSQLQERLLYGDAGFYERPGAGAGRDRDFLTSPELGPVFATCVARFIDNEWERAGRPERFAFVEAAAGRGTLARDVLASSLTCRQALAYVAVERSAELRSQQADLLGDIVRVEAAIPQDLPDAGVVFANELLDNVPVDIAEFDGDSWRSVLFDPDDISRTVLGQVVQLNVAAQPGARVPIQAQARAWVDAACRAFRRGSVVMVDYTSTTGEMAKDRSNRWLRRYSGHGWAVEGGDITCDVAVDQLPPPDAVTTQTEWLQSLGIDEIGESNRQRAEATASVGSLDHLRAMSTVSEVRALCDPEGLGGFSVLRWGAKKPATGEVAG